LYVLEMISLWGCYFHMDRLAYDILLNSKKRMK